MGTSYELEHFKVLGNENGKVDRGVEWMYVARTQQMPWKLNVWAFVGECEI